jgi:vacuolar-type H+-ATPase subunit I/STV1
VTSNVVAAVAVAAVVTTNSLHAHNLMRHTAAFVEALSYLHKLHNILRELCAAHDHHVASTDRRLAQVEIAAADAAQEARIASHQLSEIAEMLDRHGEILSAWREAAVRRTTRPALQLAADDDPA